MTWMNTKEVRNQHMMDYLCNVEIIFAMLSAKMDDQLENRNKPSDGCPKFRTGWNCGEYT
jgi:hypothetical protein